MTEYRWTPSPVLERHDAARRLHGHLFLAVGRRQHGARALMAHYGVGALCAAIIRNRSRRARLLVIAADSSWLGWVDGCCGAGDRLPGGVLVRGPTGGVVGHDRAHRGL